MRALDSKNKLLNKPMSQIKCAFSVYASITIAVIATIVFVVVVSNKDSFQELAKVIPAITGLTWIIAIAACARSGLKANVKIGVPYYWWWK